jgi:hypothetical protein
MALEIINNPSAVPKCVVVNVEDKAATAHYLEDGWWIPTSMRSQIKTMIKLAYGEPVILFFTHSYTSEETRKKVRTNRWFAVACIDTERYLHRRQEDMYPIILILHPLPENQEIEFFFCPPRNYSDENLMPLDTGKKEIGRILNFDLNEFNGITDPEKIKEIKSRMLCLECRTSHVSIEKEFLTDKHDIFRYVLDWPTSSKKFSK